MGYMTSFSNSTQRQINLTCLLHKTPRAIHCYRPYLSKKYKMKHIGILLVGIVLLSSCDDYVSRERFTTFQYEIVAQPKDSLTDDYLKVRVFSTNGQVPDNEIRVDIDTAEVIYKSFELDSVMVGTPVTYDIQYFNDSSNTAGVNVTLRFLSNRKVVYTKRYKAGDQIWDFGLTHL